MINTSQRPKPVQDKVASERRYFKLDVDMALPRFPRREWTNEETLSRGFRAQPDKPFRGLQFPEPPKIVFVRNGRRGAVRDIYPIWIASWLVTERLKLLFERIDPEAFVFEPTEVDYSDFDEPGPAFWFCYVVRELDCVDEARSEIRYQDDVPQKNYLGLIDVKLRPEAVGAAHAFRLKYASLTNIVDDFLMTSIESEKIRGFRFVDIQHP